MGTIYTFVYVSSIYLCNQNGRWVSMGISEMVGNSALSPDSIHPMIFMNLKSTMHVATLNIKHLNTTQSTGS